MSTRKRTKASTVGSDADVSDTPKTRARGTSSAKSRTSVRKTLDEEPEFTKEETPVQTRSRARTNSVVKEEIHYEFGGPIGALGVIIGTPFVMFMLYFLCNGDVCLTNPLTFDWGKALGQIKLENFFSTEANIMYLGWMAFNVLLERILPGEVVEGTILPNSDGKRLKYTMSGHLQFWVCLLAISHAYPLIAGSRTGASDSWMFETYQIQGLMPLRLELIYDHYLQLISISLLSTALFSVYLYVSSFIPEGKLLARGGNTGSAIYDYFIGRELNPRIGSFDLKEFAELRPGLIGWLVINIGMAVKQYLNRQAATGTGSISMSMFLITLLQGFYVWDAVYMEKAILTTMDITTEGFGFMLCFGSLSWVPLTYTLQARYLVDHDPQLPTWQVVAVVAVQLLGYYIFRSSNSEKDAFRSNPDSPQVAHLEFLQTKRGTKLLTSGWWGAARKINYTGDWLVTFSWCLLCGFDSPIPYFQAIYFMILLIHRAIRDDAECAKKYGDDWDEYKRRVPYWFVPGVI